MPKICYTAQAFSDSSYDIIAKANVIIAEYLRQGFRLTLRQLYYQFVARGLLPNKINEYKRLGSIISNARLAGWIEWEASGDRTRNLRGLATWESPGDIIEDAANQYKNDLWANQENRIEVWIEKEALSGVFERVCNQERVPFFCCRGYTSQSEMWSAAVRLQRHADGGQAPIILHFGDHDPSGIDMTRDIKDRLAIFGCDLQLDRLALNMDQVNKYNPPPNPAKETDSRFQAYIQRFGSESWELDALEPQLLANLVSQAVADCRDQTRWEDDLAKEERERSDLKLVSARWPAISRYVNRHTKSAGGQ